MACTSAIASLPHEPMPYRQLIGISLIAASTLRRVEQASTGTDEFAAGTHRLPLAAMQCHPAMDSRQRTLSLAVVTLHSISTTLVSHNGLFLQVNRYCATRPLIHLAVCRQTRTPFRAGTCKKSPESILEEGGVRGTLSRSCSTASVSTGTPAASSSPSRRCNWVGHLRPNH